MQFEFSKHTITTSVQQIDGEKKIKIEEKFFFNFIADNRTIFFPHFHTKNIKSISYLINFGNYFYNSLT